MFLTVGGAYRNKRMRAAETMQRIASNQSDYDSAASADIRLLTAMFCVTT